MKVITVNEPGLDWQARDLSRMVKNDHPTPFGAVLAVRKGGSYVAEAFLRHFPKEMAGNYFEIDLHRPSSKYKKGLLVSVLPHVPIWILNTMRFTEAFLLKAQQCLFGIKVPKVDLPEGFPADDDSDVLVIDDAVDSGATLKGVTEAIHAIKPGRKIKILAITVTNQKPLVMADYYLYHDSTLVRFPWSKDFKQ